MSLSRQHNQSGQQAAEIFGIPELRNQRYLISFKAGRRARFVAELGGLDVSAAPLYSHNATHQSLFSKGFASVTPVQIMQARYKKEHPDAAAHPIGHPGN